MFVPNFKILSQVVSEKSLTEKKFTDTQTHTQTNICTEKAKTIYPLYTSYAGGIIKLSDLDKSRMKHGGLLDKYFCKK